MSERRTVVESAPAKLNLALHVRRRRPDGYHDLETLFAFCTDGDLVTVSEADVDTFAITGPFAAALTTDGATRWADNLVTRAADGFREIFDTRSNYNVMLEKHLPIASGIGGGSADAAATLRALAQLAGVPFDDARLLALAARLGADVPACLAGRTAFGTGRGDDLRPVAGPAGTPVLLVNPRVPLSTAAVFARWDGVDRGPLDPAAAAGWRNDLEPPARSLAPDIDDVLAALADQPGVTFARMSGSGATCFALFERPGARDAAAAAIATAHPAWWRLASVLA